MNSSFAMSTELNLWKCFHWLFQIRNIYSFVFILPSPSHISFKTIYSFKCSGVICSLNNYLIYTEFFTYAFHKFIGTRSPGMENSEQTFEQKLMCVHFVKMSEKIIDIPTFTGLPFGLNFCFLHSFQFWLSTVMWIEKWNEIE